MGIKNFSKVFNATRIVKPKDLRGMHIAIDAMTELYRASLGAKYVSALTDNEGNPTLFISVLLLNIFDFHKNGVKQTWVFDYNQSSDEAFHNPSKLDELVKRKKRKEEALEKIKKIQEEEPLFSDDEDSGDNINNNDNKTNEDIDADELLNVESETTTKTQVITKPIISNKDKLNSLEKQVFSVSSKMIEELKLILNCLNISWVEAPAGFEGEAIASYLNISGKVNAVYSGDTDPIAFGAPTLLRKNPKDKKIYEYTQDDILKQISDANDEFEDPDISDIRKAAIALGTDMSEKTPGIGAKTVLKKLHTIRLTKKQKEAIKHFEKQPNDDDIKIYNNDKMPFVDCPVDNLIRWLVDVKKFKEHLWKPRFEKAATGVTEEKKTKKTSVKKQVKKEIEDEPLIRKPKPQ